MIIINNVVGDGSQMKPQDIACFDGKIQKEKQKFNDRMIEVYAKKTKANTYKAWIEICCFTDFNDTWFHDPFFEFSKYENQLKSNFAKLNAKVNTYHPRPNSQGSFLVSMKNIGFKNHIMNHSSDRFTIIADQ